MDAAKESYCAQPKTLLPANSDESLALLLLACTLTPSAVFGHGYIVNPEMTWVVNPFYDKKPLQHSTTPAPHLAGTLSTFTPIFGTSSTATPHTRTFL
ncbi:hypothetical protein GQ600_18781 [Phytophthora cactorum]|nr:hypothetical protein GQ600_18781 [Phytophthora cactorum]